MFFECNEAIMFTIIIVGR